MTDHQPAKLEDKTTETDAFSRHAEEADPGFIAEFSDFLLHNQKWWLTPIIVVILLMGIMVALSGTPAAPFIYTLW